MRHRLATVIVLVLLGLFLSASAWGRAPGSGGDPGSGLAARTTRPAHSSSGSALILFVRGAYIWSCRPDGSGQRRLAKAGQGAVAVAWSPDHRSISFIRSQGGSNKGTLWRMNADGSGQRQLAYSGPSLTQDCGGLAWSPDGNLIAGGNFSGMSGHVAVLDLRTMTSRNLFQLLTSVNGIETLSWSPDQAQLLVVQEGGDSSWLMRIDASSGTLLQNYTSKQPGISAASYSPRGDRIAYSYADLGHSRFGMRIAKIDGTPVRSLSHGRQYKPLWSPNGKQIVYSADQGLFVIGSDGQGRRRIVKGGHAEAWR